MKQNKFLPLLAASIIFASPPQSIGVGVPSAAFTLSVPDSIPQTGCIALETSSKTGQFSSSQANWNPATVLTMNKSTSNRSFFYKDSTAGTYTLTISFALKPTTVTDSCAAWPQAQWGTVSHATQSITVGTSSSQPASSSAPSAITQTTVSAAPSNAGPETLTIKVTTQPVVAVGAGSSFTGSATNSRWPTGLDSRYVWNFGDGSIKEGQTVFHTYTYPGTYNVMLSASSGDKAGIGRVSVQVVSAQISMLAEPDGSVLISNRSSQELNIGLWNISSGMSSFQIPQDTIVSGGQSVRFSPDVMHMVAAADAVLKYPNNFPVSVIVPMQKPSSPESGGSSAVGGAPQRDGARTEQISSKKSEYPETAIAAEAVESPPILWPYVLGALGIILTGVGLFFKKNPMKKVTNRAIDEFDIEG